MPHVKVTMTGELADYLRSVSLQEPEILQRLREETAAHPMAGMQITPEQGQFMAVLAHLLNASSRSKWACSPATAHLPSRWRYLPTARSSPATFRANTPPSPASTGAKPASNPRSTCAWRPLSETLDALHRRRPRRHVRLRLHRRRQGKLRQLLRARPGSCCAPAA